MWFFIYFIFLNDQWNVSNILSNEPKRNKSVYVFFFKFATLERIPKNRLLYNSLKKINFNE